MTWFICSAIMLHAAITGHETQARQTAFWIAMGLLVLGIMFGIDYPN